MTTLIGVCLRRRFAATLLLFCFVSTAAAATPEEAARGLLQRLLPQKADRFTLESIPQDAGRNVFEIESVDGQIVVRGSDGVAIASGVNWYLKYFCKCHVSWCGDQLQLPDPLPTVTEKIRRTSPHKFRYCFNFCTFSYTLAYWDWPQWERMIDWLALQGINMPLSVTGQEAIWYKVYRDLGLSDEAIDQFLVGPGYLGFGWMGCIDGWGGPLPASWIDGHLRLQKKIVARQRELGMLPVLQGFTGHVPAALGDVFPKAKLRRLRPWCGFPPTHFVDPQDSLFRRIGKMFIEEQTRQFGTDHLYAADTFIEMPPLDNNPEFLAQMGGALYEAMRAGDPAAIWVMQGWIFVNAPAFWKPPQAKALFGSVPDDRLILLDLAGEARPVWRETEAFYGKPWIWCIIQNYGGVVSLHGGLPQIARNLDAALTSPKRGKMSGIGLINEGLGCNAIVYDFLTDMTWRSEVPELDEWISQYVQRRYGRSPPVVEEAWRLLAESVYTAPDRTSSVVCARPTFEPKAQWLPTAPPYNPAKLVRAWQKLLQGADDLQGIDTYRFDLVNVTRQVLGDYAGVLHNRIVDAYRTKQQRTLTETSGRFLQLIRDLDQLVGTRRELLLGKWIADAKRWATDEDEKRLYEWNARNMVTLWGPRDSVLHEYARKQWSGLLGGFYLPRWKMFFDRLDESLAAGKPFDTDAFEAEVLDWEVDWTHGTEPYSADPQGAAVAVARRLWTDYGAEVMSGKK